MTNDPKCLCCVPRLWLIVLNLMLVVSLLLNVIVAVGNWNLFSRVKKIETTIGLSATPQSQQKP